MKWDGPRFSPKASRCPIASTGPDGGPVVVGDLTGVDLVGEPGPAFVADVQEEVPAIGDVLVSGLDDLLRHGREHRDVLPDGGSGESDDGVHAEGLGEAGGVLHFFGGPPADAFGVTVAPERGLDARTVAGYVGQVKPFLTVFPSPDHWRELTARQISVFVTQRAVGRCGASIKAEANALRGLLRWMWLEKSTSAPLADAVGSFAADRGTRPPQALSATEVAVLKTAVTERADRLRNEAMIALMLRLGLRAGEIAVLRLEDIDWQAGLLRVQGKGTHLDELPLPVDVGEALASYVMKGRPLAAGRRQVFLKSPAPHTGLSVPAVSLMVSRALLRGGVTGSGAAHRLRHTAACGVLAAGGGLIETGQLLRHTRVGSTAIYAKADLPALRGLARPWPTLKEGQ